MRGGGSSSSSDDSETVPLSWLGAFAFALPVSLREIFIIPANRDGLIASIPRVRAVGWAGTTGFTASVICCGSPESISSGGYSVSSVLMDQFPDGGNSSTGGLRSIITSRPPSLTQRNRLWASSSLNGFKVVPITTKVSTLDLPAEIKLTGGSRQRATLVP